MIINFDLSLLDRFQRESLEKILDVIQLGNKLEIIVKAVELPYKFLVFVDNGIVSLKGSACRKRIRNPIRKRKPRAITGARDLLCDVSGRG